MRDDRDSDDQLQESEPSLAGRVVIPADVPDLAHVCLQAADDTPGGRGRQVSFVTFVTGDGVSYA